MRELHITATLLSSGRGAGDKEELMTTDSDWATTVALAAFDGHLRRARGVCADLGQLRQVGPGVHR